MRTHGEQKSSQWPIENTRDKTAENHYHQDIKMTYTLIREAQ